MIEWNGTFLKMGFSRRWVGKASTGGRVVVASGDVAE